MENLAIRVPCHENGSRHYHAVSKKQMVFLLDQVKDDQMIIDENDIVEGRDVCQSLSCIGCNRFMANMSSLVQCKICKGHICG